VSFVISLMKHHTKSKNGEFFKHIGRVVRYREDMEVSPILRKPREELLDVNLQPWCFVTSMS
jgi:hypothetical protein